LKEPAHRIVELKGTDEEVLHTVKEVMSQTASGRHGRKIIFKLNDD